MVDVASLAVEALVVLIVLAILLSGIRVLREWERAPILSLGRYKGLKGPGVIYVVPFINRVPFTISTRLQTVSFKTEQTFTKDNVPVVVDSVMYYQPADLQKVVLGAENYIMATQLAAQTTLREVIGQVSFDDLLTEREKIGAKAREVIDSKTESWGIKVTAVEIRDVGIPSALQDAMSRNAQAERERRARVTLALAEFEAAQKMVDAANLYANNDRAFQLRWMNIIYELGLQGKNTILLIPSNIPIAGTVAGLRRPSPIPPIGVMGIQELAKKAQSRPATRPEIVPAFETSALQAFDWTRFCIEYISTSSFTVVASSGPFSSRIFPVNFGNRSASPLPGLISFIAAGWMGESVSSEAMVSITTFGRYQMSGTRPDSTSGGFTWLSYWARSFGNLSRSASLNPVPILVTLGKIFVLLS